MGTEKLQFYSSNGNVAVVSCFSSHLAFQWVALSFSKVLSIQIRPCLCWKGDRKHGFFLDVLFDPCTTEWPVDESCIYSPEAVSKSLGRTLGPKLSSPFIRVLLRPSISALAARRDHSHCVGIAQTPAEKKPGL